MSLSFSPIFYAFSFKYTIVQGEGGRIVSGIPGEGSSAASRLVVGKIHTLDVSHREEIHRHLLALSARDRYLRFGFNATDQQIDIYVEQIDFDYDDVFGIFDEQHNILGTSHLAYGKEGSPSSHVAEFGVSVGEQARGMGLGGQLFAYSAQRAASRGVDQMFIHTINKNIPMIKIIKRAGAEVFRDQGEIDAYLTLPANDNAWLKMRTDAQENLDLPDYGIKVKLKCFQKCTDSSDK